MNNFHSMTEYERQLVNTVVSMKALKLDNVIDAIIDKFHDFHVMAYHLDINVRENERKKDYDLNTVFTTRYFLGSNNRDTSRDPLTNEMADMIVTIFEELKNKTGITYSLNRHSNGMVYFTLTLHDMDLNDLDADDEQNYALYQIASTWQQMTEEQRKDAYIARHDDYSILHDAVYSMGSLTITGSMNPRDGVIYMLQRLFSCLIDIRPFKELIDIKLQ